MTFFKTGENEEFDFDLKKAMAKGADFKDYIAPDSLEFKKDYIKIGDKYAMPKSSMIKHTKINLDTENTRRS